MPYPTINPLPSPPTRADAPSDFTAKADALVAALPGMVTQINAAGDYMEQRAASVDDSVTAAADSATAAAQSATDAANQVALAAEQVTLAGAQVVLAANEATRSEDAATQAEIAAAAAGAAAGLPALAGNGRKFLQVAPDASGVRFGEAEQAIGDALITGAVPDSTYLATGGIYLQPAYQDLFDTIGLIGGDVGKQWAAVDGAPSVASAANIISTDGDGVWIVAGFGSSGIYRSADDGLTWTLIADPGAFARIATDGKGKWISAGPERVALSSDNGVNWSIKTQAPISSFTSVSGLDTDGNGKWVALANTATGTRPFFSLDNGESWAQLGSATNLYNFVKHVEGDIWLAGLNGAGMLRSVDGGLTWATAAGFTASASSVAKSKNTPGVLLVAGSASGAGAGFRSEDNGATWVTTPIGFGSVAASGVDSGDGGVFVVVGNNTMSRSSDEGRTWAAVNGAVAGNGISVVVGKNGTGILTAGSGGPSIKRSTPSFPYDTATQFAVPKVQAPLGLKSFIKARLAP